MSAVNPPLFPENTRHAVHVLKEGTLLKTGNLKGGGQEFDLFAVSVVSKRTSLKYFKLYMNQCCFRLFPCVMDACLCFFSCYQLFWLTIPFLCWLAWLNLSFSYQRDWVQPVFNLVISTHTFKLESSPESSLSCYRFAHVAFSLFPPFFSNPKRSRRNELC